MADLAVLAAIVRIMFELDLGADGEPAKTVS
jgi:hypothetical protein